MNCKHDTFRHSVTFPIDANTLKQKRMEWCECGELLDTREWDVPIPNPEWSKATHEIDFGMVSELTSTKGKVMATKKLVMPVIGEDVLFNLNGNARPAKVVLGSDGLSTYLGLSVQTCGDGTPSGTDWCSPVFFAYCNYGTQSGQWRPREEIFMKRYTLTLDESTGQIVNAATEVQTPQPVVEQAPVVAPVPVVEPAPVVEESPSLPVGVGGCLSPDSNLGKIVFLQIETIKAAATKIMGMTKNGRITVTGAPADVEQFQTMVEAIGHSQEELRTVLFGS